MQTIFTIGHSTRSIDEFIELLNDNDVSQLVDVRSVPGSRHNPQYGQQALESSLEQSGIKYAYLGKLGGLRPTVKDSVNDAWRNKSFRGYADYMQTDEFTKGIDELLSLSANTTTAIMCAEAVPWRCHRSLVADALLVRGIPVCEIISKSNVREHVMTDFAVVKGARVTYPKSALNNDNPGK